MTQNTTPAQRPRLAAVVTGCKSWPLAPLTLSSRQLEKIGYGYDKRRGK
jgi:hypothetical protein